jgi:hypothetical protein
MPEKIAVPRPSFSVVETEGDEELHFPSEENPKRRSAVGAFERLNQTLAAVTQQRCYYFTFLARN